MSIIFILASLGVTFGYAYPRYNSMTGSSELEAKSVKELKDSVIQYEAALEKTREIEEVRNGLLTKYNSITEADRVRIEKMMPDNIDSVRMVIDINNIAQLVGMSLREISLTEPTSQTERKDANNTQVVVARPSAYTYMTLSFSVTGAYNSLIAFLGGLEKSLRIADVSDLSIEEASTKDTDVNKSKVFTEPLYKMKVSVKTYYLSSR